MATFASMIANREPTLQHCIGFMDGLHLPLQNAAAHVTQNAYYNGWLATTTISCVFIFSPCGDVIWAALNYPGSWHDSSVAMRVYDVLLDPNLMPTPFYIIADSAFPHQGDLGAKLKTPLTKRQHRTANEADKAFSSCLVKVRQAAEWGMRGLQSKFPRLTVPLPIDDQKRLLICQVSVLLYNLKIRTIGLSQIRTVFHDEIFE